MESFLPALVDVFLMAESQAIILIVRGLQGDHLSDKGHHRGGFVREIPAHGKCELHRC